MGKKNIGELLRSRRDALSLTQRQVANQVGVTESTVSRWESGDIDNMRRDKISCLANVLKISPLLIMGIDDSEFLYKPVNGEELEVLQEFRKLDFEGKNLVCGILRKLNLTHLSNESVINNNLGGTNLIAIGGGNNYNNVAP